MSIDQNELRYQKLIASFEAEIRKHSVTGYGRVADARVKMLLCQMMMTAIDTVKDDPSLNIIDVMDCIQREMVHCSNRFKVSSTKYEKYWVDEE